MKSNSETGHAKNVANFEKVVAYCFGYGPAYQPGKASMQSQSLQQLLADTRNSLLTVTDYLTMYNLARNARMQAFKDLPVLCTRIVNVLAATDVSDKTTKDVQSIVRKIKGIRVSKKEETASPAEPATAQPETDAATEAPAENTTTNGNPTAENGNVKAPRSHSSAQTSRDHQIEHFARLMALIQSEISYQPNEVELQIGTLQMYLEQLRMTNSAVVMAEVALSNARIQRDTFLYGVKTGICDVAQDVKQYVKAVFGANSPQYKQISGLRFTKGR